ncbi:MAG TPA: NapC/NirT family cytochrome c [Ignavibacteriaceae bacterium]|nr:NapC/NirT family cytochrome c [Ignavibacteriaceae bacterium]
MKKKLFPDIFYNTTTLAGVSVALLSFGLILFLTIIEAFTPEPKVYAGIITFIILPAILILGLILIAVGIWNARKKKLRGTFREKSLPRIDLNDPKQRRSFLIFSTGTILLLFFTAFGSFKAYEYTDSVQFCGTVCHKVMEPEYTAYQNSPHSRVACVQCHIGSGAGWFVKSKISGSYQVYSVIFNKYSRPIPTPIWNLRPAQGTCEQCHWPRNFFAEKKVDFNYYLSDENNTKSKITMLLKVGGGNSILAKQTGIHWHMNIDNEVTYLAADSSRQVINWVEARNKETGKVTVYKKGNVKFNMQEMKDKGLLRTMDCIDCHNRPSHIYNQPDRMVNVFMSINMIDTTLPYIKSTSVEALEKSYSDKETALDSIDIFVRNFYSTNYPVADTGAVNKSIRAIQYIYKNNYFPEMNVSWKKYPNNVGHMYYNGCFRCHDGQHFDEQGKVLSNDCNLCHSIISQTINDTTLVSLKGLNFQHPVDLGGDIQELMCTDCHSAE